MRKYDILILNGRIQIFENESSSYIFACDSEKYARKLVSKLNRGAGFCGKTPKFFSILIKNHDGQTRKMDA